MQVNWDAYIVFATVAGCFALLFLTRKEPELILGGGLLGLLIFGVVPIDVAFSGFANQGLITIAFLYVVAAGVHQSGALKPVIEIITRGVNRPEVGVFKFTFPVAALSSFLNNTPIVAALMPSVIQWSKKKGWCHSYFLLPISYAAILGGTCTLVGTSTNLLVYGLIEETRFKGQLGFFDIGWVGVPITLIGLVYLTLFSKKILKERHLQHNSIENTREYTVEMIVKPDSSLVGKTIQQAELRNLHGLYLIEIIRGDWVLAVVGPDTRLAANDRLIFTGLVDSIGELLNINGLELAEKQVFKLTGDTGRARLVEAVIGSHNPLVGKTVKQGQFRKRYNAAIIAVVRNGQRVKAKPGDIVLRPGDTLLMLARRSFLERYTLSREFMVVNGMDDLNLGDSKKAKWAWLSLLCMIILSTSGMTSVVVAAFSAAAVVLISGCISWSKAKQSLDLQVLLTIGFALGIGKALNASGGDHLLASAIIGSFGDNPWLLLVAVYVLTLLLTEMITNSAAAVIAFSLVSGMIDAMGYNLIPFAIAIMIAASASFMSPLGYQTNLMVYSAGGYRFSDFIRLGAPLSLMVASMALVIIPFIWPF
jgi:di/tricarboxylate transporter